MFPAKKQVVSVQLQSSLDSEQMRRRIDTTIRLLSDHGFKPVLVEALGTTRIEQLLSTILLGDYVSAYIGILNGINPTPVELVEKLKKELK